MSEPAGCGRARVEPVPPGLRKKRAAGLLDCHLSTVSHIDFNFEPPSTELHVAYPYMAFQLIELHVVPIRARITSSI